ncbi:MAG: glutamyl-tRNA reductase [Candidatus Hydrogenedentes bacterium]|nr:glutamyl-tRNA reductase [Candidatus Hydrogenedentota bacterium]
MSLVVVGLSHHTSPIELRERLHFPETEISHALLQLRKRMDGAGAVVLSTCNRVETYVNHAAPPEELHREIRAFLSDAHQLPEAEFRPALYEYVDRDTVGHLFRVASSLDSMVVGENQILGQVHEAYLLAQSEQATDKIISAVFQKAFSVAKEVRSRTHISAGKVSVSSVAVDLAVSIFMDLADKTLMVIGSGEMGELTLKSLISKGVRRVLIVNRNREKGEALAAQCQGVYVPFDELGATLHRADILISSTAAPGFILQADDFQRALKPRGNEPIFAIDIAVPRDIDPAVNDLDNVYLYDVDDLQKVADENMEARRKEIAQCMELVDKGTEQFCRWMRGLIVEPTIVSMSTELNAIRERELAKTLQSLPDLTEKQRDEITYLSKRIVNTILQRPMSQLKQEAVQQDPHVILHLVKRLFGLKESP